MAKRKTKKRRATKRKASKRKVSKKRTASKKPTLTVRVSALEKRVNVIGMELKPSIKLPIRKRTKRGVSMVNDFSGSVYTPSSHQLN